MQIDPLITAAADTSRPLPMRTTVLAELHDAINAHLDEEERLILPLAAAHISAEEWDAFGQRALASIPRQHMPIVLGWPRNGCRCSRCCHDWCVSWPRCSGFRPTPSADVASIPSLSKLLGGAGRWAASDAALADLAARATASPARAVSEAARAQGGGALATVYDPAPHQGCPPLVEPRLAPGSSGGPKRPQSGSTISSAVSVRRKHSKSPR